MTGGIGQRTGSEIQVHNLERRPEEFERMFTQRFDEQHDCIPYILKDNFLGHMVEESGRFVALLVLDISSYDQVHVHIKI